MNGIIIVNKEKGFTSRDVTSIIRKIFNTSKVGHAGTLDPLATGVLVVALGTGLKILEYLSSDEKEYIATTSLGFETDTLDLEGIEVKRVDNYSTDKNKVEEILKSFLGKYNQEVPKYSSVKVNGKKLYYYARNNEEVVLPTREVEIKEIELISFEDNKFTFRVVVSKGTYIRSLIRDIGIKLGIPCSMSDLERTRQGNFQIKDASTIKDLEIGRYKIYNLKDSLTNIAIYDADDYLTNRILNGSILENRYDEQLIAFQNKEGEIIGIYTIYDKDPNKIKPVKILK